jgi:alkylation response protein AidB-like acyl-CoA dehydrogenase
MHFDYLQEHEMLRDAARGYLQRNDPLLQFRGTKGIDPGVRRQNLRVEAEQGWSGMLVPEVLGGSGLSIVEAMVVAEELGHAAHPGAFAALNAASLAIVNSGSEAQRGALLPGLVTGEPLAWAVSFGVPGADASRSSSVVAERVTDGWRMSGTAQLVQDADIADHLLVEAVTTKGLSQFIITTTRRGPEVRPALTIDVTRRFCDVTFDGLIVPDSALLGVEGGAEQPVAYQRLVAAVLTAADSVGIATRLLSMTVAYTKERLAFGKALAAFQAVKHRCADMLVQVETSRVATWYAAVAIRDSRPDMTEAASIAKFYATEAASLVASQALQLHGAIGMTWEHDLHLFYKRAKTNEMLWDSNTLHRERVATAMSI